MSKGLNVKMELWKTAHALEAKAMEAGDIAAMNEAADWKGRLALGLFTEDAPQDPPKAEFVPGNGVKDSLAGVGSALADVGVIANE